MMFGRSQYPFGRKEEEFSIVMFLLEIQTEAMGTTALFCVV
jgi:hypothetical protein